jgi:iron complex transport system ATP-binding protein
LQNWTASRWSVKEVVLSGLDGTVGLYKEHSEDESRKALSIMKELDCLKIAEHHYDRISTGEQVKALIARALISSPELVILDEPFVHLDMKSREFLMDSINSLAARENAPSMVFITQRIEDISPVFQKGMIMKNGRILERGVRDDILSEEAVFRAFDMRVKLHRSESGRYWPVVNG